MRSLSFTSVLLLLVVFVTGCDESAPTAAQLGSSIENPTEAYSRVVHQAILGSADLCEANSLPTGCDANFSLVALERANGSVSGQWQDTFANGDGYIHVDVDCLSVNGNEAWVSGLIAHGNLGGSDLTGLPAITRIADNGTSANDPPDQISFSFIGDATSCLAEPNFPLFDITAQVRVN